MGADGAESDTTSERILRASTLIVQPVYFAGRLVFALGGGVYGAAVWASDEDKAKQAWRRSLEAPWVWHVFVTQSIAQGSDTPS